MDAGDIVAIGVVQEQHPERARLYKQWRQLQWPILVDSLNLLGFKVVPIPVVLDEAGVIQAFGRFRPSTVKELSAKPPEKHEISEQYNRVSLPDPKKTRKAAGSGTFETLLAHGDACFHAGDPKLLDEAIETYVEAMKKDPDNGIARFRRGVALRRRSESVSTLHQSAPGKWSPGDAQLAVDSWGEALSRDPNQYIWRRRIQQYGPRLAKPYNFYFWVEQARKEISERGEEPLPLTVEPMGSEIADRARKSEAGNQVNVPDPDPDGKIQRDTRLIVIDTLVTPAVARPGTSVRVRSRLMPTAQGKWNNEGEPLTLSVDLPEGFRAGDGSFVHPAVSKAESDELRYLEFEIAIPSEGAGSVIRFPAYALYNVCETNTGVCRYVRQDFQVVVRVDSNAPKISR